MDKQDINIVWFKRDLRFTDHEPLHSAQRENIPLLLIYFFEPSLIAYDDSDVRHWRFVHESLQEMQEKLKSINTQIYIFHNEAQTVFTKLKILGFFCGKTANFRQKIRYASRKVTASVIKILTENGRVRYGHGRRINSEPLLY